MCDRCFRDRSSFVEAVKEQRKGVKLDLTPFPTIEVSAETLNSIKAAQGRLRRVKR